MACEQELENLTLELNVLEMCSSLGANSRCSSRQPRA